MSRHRNLLIALLVILGIVMATGCSPAAPTPAVEEPAQSPATQEPTEAPATEAVQATEAPAFGPGTTITYIASQDWIKDSELELAKQFEEETGLQVLFADHPIRPVF